MMFDSTNFITELEKKLNAKEFPMPTSFTVSIDVSCNLGELGHRFSRYTDLHMNGASSNETLIENISRHVESDIHSQMGKLNNERIPTLIENVKNGEQWKPYTNSFELTAFPELAGIMITHKHEPDIHRDILITFKALLPQSGEETRRYTRLIIDAIVGLGESYFSMDDSLISACVW